MTEKIEELRTQLAKVEAKLKEAELEEAELKDYIEREANKYWNRHSTLYMSSKLEDIYSNVKSNFIRTYKHNDLEHNKMSLITAKDDYIEMIEDELKEFTQLCNEVIHLTKEQ